MKITYLHLGSIETNVTVSWCIVYTQQNILDLILRTTGKLIFNIDTLNTTTLNDLIENVSMIENMKTVMVLGLKVLNSCLHGSRMVHSIINQINRSNKE